MRPILLALMAAVLATACASKDDDKDAPPPSYSSGAAEPAPDIDIGTWTGFIGPELTTILLADDGSGLYCTSSGDKATVNKMRYRSGLLMTEADQKVSITDASGNTMKVIKLDPGATNFDLHRDEDLSLASAPCAKKLAKMRR